MVSVPPSWWKSQGQRIDYPSRSDNFSPTSPRSDAGSSETSRQQKLNSLNILSLHQADDHVEKEDNINPLRRLRSSSKTYHPKHQLFSTINTADEINEIVSLKKHSSLKRKQDGIECSEMITNSDDSQREEEVST